MTVWHYTGHLIRGNDDPRWQCGEERVREEISHVLSTNSAQILCGSLGCGADILCVEVGLELGLELQVFLPFDAQTFCLTSVECGGQLWVERYHRLLKTLPAPHILNLPEYISNPEKFSVNSRVAMAAARSEAARQKNRPQQLAIWDQAPDTKGAGGDVAMWRTLGESTVTIALPAARLRE